VLWFGFTLHTMAHWEVVVGTKLPRKSDSKKTPARHRRTVAGFSRLFHAMNSMREAATVQSTQRFVSSAEKVVAAVRRTSAKLRWQAERAGRRKKIRRSQLG
jgi:hypothetical protein